MVLQIAVTIVLPSPQFATREICPMVFWDRSKDVFLFRQRWQYCRGTRPRCFYSCSLSFLTSILIFEPIPWIYNDACTFVLSGFSVVSLKISPWGALAFWGFVPCKLITKNVTSRTASGFIDFPHAGIPFSTTPFFMVLKTFLISPPCNQYSSVRLGPMVFPPPSFR